MRVTSAVEFIPRVSMGSTIPSAREPDAEYAAGSQPNFTAKTITPIRPSQKCGADAPTSVNTIVQLSKTVYCRRAEMIPAGIPTMIANKSAANDNRKVYGMRCMICSITSKSFLYDVPKSPCTKFQINRPYLSRKGSLSPMLSRSSSICSAVASTPSLETAGSPGVMSITVNTMNVAPSKTGISIRIRFTMYFSILLSSFLLVFPLKQL